MEIRTNKKFFKRIEYQCKRYNRDIEITVDDKCLIPVIIVQHEGKFYEWTSGIKNILSYLRYGYVRIIKNCPHRLFNCIGEKCSLYLIKNNTGDCTHIWNNV